MGFFVLFLVLVAMAPEQVMQVLLVAMWGSMGIATLYSIGKMVVNLAF